MMCVLRRRGGRRGVSGGTGSPCASRQRGVVFVQHLLRDSVVWPTSPGRVVVKVCRVLRVTLILMMSDSIAPIATSALRWRPSRFFLSWLFCVSGNRGVSCGSWCGIHRGSNVCLLTGGAEMRSSMLVETTEGQILSSVEEVLFMTDM